MSLPKLEQPKIFSDPSKLASCGFEGHLGALVSKNGEAAKTPDPSGGSPITWAARAGHASVVRMLTKHGADVNTSSWKSLRPLHHATNGLHEEIAKDLLDSGVQDVDAKDDGGSTALHVAATRGVVAMCQLLVERGANVNAANASGVTPLHFAANMGQVSVVTYLLSKGAMPGAADAQGNTPLHFASRSGFGAIVKLLISAGASAATANTAGQTPLDVALDADIAQAFVA